MKQILLLEPVVSSSDKMSSSKHYAIEPVSVV